MIPQNYHHDSDFDMRKIVAYRDVSLSNREKNVERQEHQIVSRGLPQSAKIGSSDSHSLRNISATTAEIVESRPFYIRTLYHHIRSFGPYHPQFLWLRNMHQHLNGYLIGRQNGITSSLGRCVRWPQKAKTQPWKVILYWVCSWKIDTQTCWNNAARDVDDNLRTFFLPYPAVLRLFSPRQRTAPYCSSIHELFPTNRC